jgi:hypothetical protein
VHQSRCGLDREEDKNDVKLTRGSWGRWDTGEDVRQRGADGRLGTRRGGGCGLGLVLPDAGVLFW